MPPLSREVLSSPTSPTKVNGRRTRPHACRPGLSQEWSRARTRKGSPMYDALPQGAAPPMPPSVGSAHSSEPEYPSSVTLRALTLTLAEGGAGGRPCLAAARLRARAHGWVGRGVRTRPALGKAGWRALRATLCCVPEAEAAHGTSGPHTPWPRHSPEQAIRGLPARARATPHEGHLPPRGIRAVRDRGTRCTRASDSE